MSLRRRRGRAAAKDNGANEHDDSKIDNVVDDAKDADDIKDHDQSDTAANDDDSANAKDADVKDHRADQSADTAPFTTVGSYWLTRVIFMRFLAGIYLVAFCVSLEQNPALIGSHGLTPVDKHLDGLRRRLGFGRTPVADMTWAQSWALYQKHPTVFWFVPPEVVSVDGVLAGLGLSGAALAALVLVRGGGNAFVLTAMWLLYMSLVKVGQRWFSFGWETQLLETGFIGIFFAPLWSLRALPVGAPTPAVALWGCRWLIFRIYIARHDSAEDFSRLGALLCTATARIFIPAYCFDVP